MKRSVYFIFIIFLAFALNACSAKIDDSEVYPDELLAKWVATYQSDDLVELLAKWVVTYQNVCPIVTDAVKYPVPWNVDVDRAFVIPLETIRSMSTCGLLETMLTNPSLYTHDKSEIRLAPWPPASSSLFADGITQFNNQLRKDPMAVEFFKRRDCFSVLASKYITFIMENEKLPEKIDISGGFVRNRDLVYLEMLLASDLCMSVMNKTKINQIMAMALAYEEIADYNGHFVSETYNIMIAIMLWHNYIPFVKEVVPRLRESTFGYCLTDINGNLRSNKIINFSDDDCAYLVVKHAKNFLTEQKI